MWTSWPIANDVYICAVIHKKILSISMQHLHLFSDVFLECNWINRNRAICVSIVVICAAVLLLLLVVGWASAIATIPPSILVITPLVLVVLLVYKQKTIRLARNLLGTTVTARQIPGFSNNIQMCAEYKIVNIQNRVYTTLQGQTNCSTTCLIGKNESMLASILS